MSLTTEKIVKLRELAERGVDGEKENAKRILTNNGIDWQKPKETIINTIKKSVGANITKEYAIDIKKLSDPIHVTIILNRLEVKYKGIRIGNGKILFNSTPAEAQKLKDIFFKNRDSFDDEIFNYAYQNINFSN